MRQNNYQVVIKAITWNRDSHGLFDYESRHIYKRNLQTVNSCKIVRVNHEIMLIQENQQIPENAKILASIQQKQTDPKSDYSYSVNMPDNSEGSDKFWLVVRSLKQNNGVIGYQLQQNDIIKLGRVKFNVKEIATDCPQELDTEVDTMDLQASLPCRICLSEEYSMTNPMITPCQCDGTCLQKWIKSKCVNKNTTVTSSYYWKSLDCEVCKQPYPMTLENTLKNGNLIELNKPSSDYIVLENQQKEKQNSRIIHVVDMKSKKQVVLGRGHDSDVRISDISVSRSHAIISINKENQFFLEDNNSKFGTLVQIKKPVFLCDQNYIAIQIGRSVINFALKKIHSGESQISSLLQETIIQRQITLQEQIKDPAESESSEEAYNSFDQKCEHPQL